MVDSASQNLRKRALEALERRRAVAKLLQQQTKKKKISSTVEFKKQVKGKSDLNDSSSIVGSRNLYGSSTLLPSEDKFTNKGDESDPVYFTLSVPVNENLMATNMEVSNNKGVVNKICRELRTGGYLKQSKELKVDPWILLDNYVPKRAGMIGSRQRALQSKLKRSKRHMSIKQHKKCGTFDLPSDFHKFEIFLPPHDMWKSYMKQRLRNVGPEALARSLSIADLHGAMIVVVECKIPAFTRISGIMIRETAETLGIVTKDDKFRVVPKKSSVFIFQWDCWKVTLLGDKLSSRLTGLPSCNLIQQIIHTGYPSR